MTDFNRLPVRPQKVPLDVYMRLHPEAQLDTENYKIRNNKDRSLVKMVVAGIALGAVLVGVTNRHELNEKFGSSSDAEMSVRQKDLVTPIVDPEDYTPARIDCQPIAVVSANSVTPIKWNIKNLPVAGTEDIPDMGKGKIVVDSCIGNIVDNLDEEATKKTGIRTYTMPLNDMTFSLDTSDYKNGFPDYSKEQLVAALRSSNPDIDESTLQQAASAITNTIDQYDPARYALHVESLKNEIVRKYGTKLVEAARESARNVFEKNASDSGLGKNNVWLRFENGESSALEFITKSDPPPEPDTLPFEYQESQTRRNMTVYVLDTKQNTNDSQEQQP